MRKLLSILLFLVALPLSAQQHPNLLFHISKSANRNIICYEAVVQNGALNTKQPVHVFWHNNEDRPGAEDELNYIQKKFAYGYKTVKCSPSEAEITLKAYEKRSLKVRRQGGKWCAFIPINGKESLLREIYIKSKEGHSTTVEYVILKGTYNGTAVQEKLLNK